VVLFCEVLNKTDLQKKRTNQNSGLNFNAGLYPHVSRANIFYFDLHPSLLSVKRDDINDIMLVMLLWVYIHIGQAWKICLATVGIEPTTFGICIQSYTLHPLKFWASETPFRAFWGEISLQNSQDYNIIILSRVPASSVIRLRIISWTWNRISVPPSFSINGFKYISKVVLKESGGTRPPPAPPPPWLRHCWFTQWRVCGPLINQLKSASVVRFRSFDFRYHYWWSIATRSYNATINKSIFCWLWIYSKFLFFDTFLKLQTNLKECLVLYL
jgi:hypothetical protein